MSHIYDMAPLVEALSPLPSISTLTPMARSCVTVVSDQTDVYCFGGHNPFFQAQSFEEFTRDGFPFFKELLKFNIASKKWQRLITDGTTPTVLMGHKGVLFNRYLIILGTFESVHPFVCHLDELVWREMICEGDIPTDLEHHAMAVVDNCLYVNGGEHRDANLYGEMFKLDFSTNIWTVDFCSPRRDDGPASRKLHNLVSDGRRYLYMIGGTCGGSAVFMDRVWRYDTWNKKWQPLTIAADPSRRKATPLSVFTGYPRARQGMASVYYPNRIYMTGGYDENGNPPSDDIWKLDLVKNCWRRLTFKLPRPLKYHGMTVNPDGYLYVFGGQTSGTARLSFCKQIFHVPSGVTRPLKEICWKRLLGMRNFSSLSPSTMYSIGIPSIFISRMD